MYYLVHNAPATDKGWQANACGRTIWRSRRWNQWRATVSQIRTLVRKKERCDDQRQDHADRAPRVSDRGVQGADDLQPVVRAGGHRRRRRADGRQARRLPGVPALAVPAHQHPRRAGDDAAQGRRPWRCVDEVTPTGARSPAPATRSSSVPTARCSATCSTAPASCAASSARAARSPARARWSSARAASARRSPRRWRRPASRRSACSTRTRPSAEALARAAARALSASSPCAPARTTRPATTSSSTRRRSA